MRFFTFELAGPFANILFAAAVIAGYGVTMGVGDKLVSTQVTKVLGDGPAAKAGLMVGDKIEAINQTPFASHRWYLALLKKEVATPVRYTVTRRENNTERTFDLVFGAEKRGKSPAYIEPGFRYPLPALTARELAALTWRTIWEATKEIFAQVSLAPSGIIDPDGMTGPVALVTYISDSAKKGYRDFLITIIGLNILLAVLNLFPIPPLDGWAFITLAADFVCGRRIGENFQRALSRATMSFFLALTLFLLGKDILLLF